jgi:Protein of unknown function (DUF2628)
MMARFLVLNDRTVPRGDGVTFVRDGFRTFALFLPLFWLLWHRLWLHAALAFALMGISTWAASVFMPEALGAVTTLVNFAIGLAAALEGPAWQASDLERKGHAVQYVIIAGSLREAEEVHASRLPETFDTPRPVMRGFQTVSQASLIPLAGT